MATTQQIHEIQGETQRSPVGSGDDLPVSAVGLPSRTQLLELTSKLQISLDAQELITLFDTELKAFVRHSGLLYLHKDGDLEVKLGQRAVHTCNYQLVIEKQSLGELTFMRRQKFTDNEIASIETLLCTLVHPLNNALRYRKAVQCAFTDPLTGACNRAAYENAIKRELSLARRQRSPFSLIIFDIDRFKAINDEYGHLVGDDVLKALTDCAQQTIRSSDMLFRYGGEEFVVLLNNTSDRGASLLAERLRKAVEKLTWRANGKLIEPTISLGVATLKNRESGEHLLMRADTALYQAKGNGRNQVVDAN